MLISSGVGAWSAIRKFGSDRVGEKAAKFRVAGYSGARYKAGCHPERSEGSAVAFITFRMPSNAHSPQGRRDTREPAKQRLV